MAAELLGTLVRGAVLVALLALAGLVLASWPRQAAGDDRAGAGRPAAGEWLFLPVQGLGGLVSVLTVLALVLPLRGALLVSLLAGAGLLAARGHRAWRARRRAAAGAAAGAAGASLPAADRPADAAGVTSGGGAAEQRSPAPRRGLPGRWGLAGQRPDAAVLAVAGSAVAALLVAGALPALIAGRAAALLPVDGEATLPGAQWLWQRALAAGPPSQEHPLLRVVARLLAEGTLAWSVTVLHALASRLAGGDVVAGYWLAQGVLLALAVPATFLLARDVLGLPRWPAAGTATLAWANPLSLWLVLSGAPGHLALLVLTPATLVAVARALRRADSPTLAGAGLLGAALLLAWPPAAPGALVLVGAGALPLLRALAPAGRGPGLRRLAAAGGLSLLPVAALSAVLLLVRPALAAYARGATLLAELAPGAEPHTVEAGTLLPALSDLLGPAGMALLALLAALVGAGLVAAGLRRQPGWPLAAACLGSGALALVPAAGEVGAGQALAPLVGIAPAVALAAVCRAPGRVDQAPPRDRRLPVWTRWGLVGLVAGALGSAAGLAGLAGRGLVAAGREGALGAVLAPEPGDLAALRAAVPPGSRVWFSPQALAQPELAGQARLVAGVLALALPQQHFVGQVRTQLVEQGQPLDTDAADVAILGQHEAAEAVGLAPQDLLWARGVLRAYARRPRWVALPARELVWLGRLNLLHQLVLDMDAAAIRVRSPAGAATITPALPVRQVELALLSPQEQEVTLRLNGQPDRRQIGPGLVLWRSGALTPAGPDGRPARQEVIVEPAAPLYVLALRLSNTYRGAGTELLGTQALLVGGRCRPVPEGLEVQLDYLNLQLDVEAAWGLQLEATPLGARERVGWWEVPVVVRAGEQVVSLTLQPQERQSRLLINGLPFEGRSTWQEGPRGRAQLTLTLSKNARPERTLTLCRYSVSEGQVTLEPDPGALLVLRPGQRDETPGRAAPQS